MLKGLTAATIGLLAINIIGLIFQPLLARALGPEGYGYFGVFMSFFTILSYTLLLGLDEASKKFLNSDAIRNLETSIIILIIGISAGLFSVISALIMYSANLGSFLFPNTTTFLLFISALIAVFPSNLNNIALSFLYTDYFEDRAEFLHVLNRLLFLSVSFAAVYTGRNILVIPLIMMASYLLTGFIGLTIYYIRKILMLKPLKGLNQVTNNLQNSISKKSVKILRFGGVIVLINLFFNLHFHFDVIAVNWMTDTENTGIYKAMIVVAHFLWLIPAATSKIMLHNFSDMISKSKVSQVTENTDKLFSYSIIFSILLGIGLISLAEPFITLYYGMDYVEGVLTLQILSVGAAIGFSAVIFSPALEALDKEKHSAKAAALSAITNICLNLLLIPIYGINGAAVATALSYSSMLIFYTYFYWKETRSNPIKPLMLTKLALNSFLLYLTLYLGRLVVQTDIFQLIILPPVGLTIFIIGGLALGLIQTRELRKLYEYTFSKKY